MTQAKKQVSTIHIPHQLIDNTVIGEKVPIQATFLYTILKMSNRNNNVKINVSTLKNKLGWKSTKTLKKYLVYLKEHKYIEYEKDELPKFTPMEIRITDMDRLREMQNIEFIRKNGTVVNTNSNLFETIPREVINLILTNTKTIVGKNNKTMNFQEHGIRLAEFYYKQHNSCYGYAFPSYNEINKATGMSSEYISLLNALFENKKIFKIIHGDFYKEELELDDGVTTRLIKERNKYVPLF